ncbi:MAG: CHASE3 domain-containing protein, partial [Rhizobiales bacterium]|nr:CHASE3 domain-containing protein [Hyphomicrobiales bacterium]
MTDRPASGTKSQLFGLDPSVALGLVAAFLFFIASAAVAYLNFNALRVANQRIVQTHQAIVSLDVLLSQIQDAETGQRGFLLTGEEPYLAPYSAALRAIPAQLDEIEDRTSLNTGQSEALALLRQRVDAKLAELAETIDLQRSGQIDAAMAIVRADGGRIEMDAIRSQIAAMAQAETQVRGQRLAEMEQAQQRALLSTFLSGLLGLLLTGVIAFLVRRATAARRREEWLQSGEVALGAATMGDLAVEQLGDSILDFLADYTGAVAGA